MRVKVTLTDKFGELEDKLQETTVIEDSEGTIDEVLLTIVKALIGHTFSEDLIKEYINYSSDDNMVFKIGD